MLLAASALISLFVFWILLSGYFTTFLLTAGVGCSLAVVLLARRMGILDLEGHPVTMLPRALLYTGWLIREIIKSAWVVSKIILHPRLPISPTLVRFKPTQRTVVGLVTHANSITLTPGTITMQAEPEEFLVHSLTREGAEGVASGEMDAHVSACEGRR